jgi:uncharacterized membrane protein YbaN (DUF454 family)
MVTQAKKIIKVICGIILIIIGIIGIITPVLHGATFLVIGLILLGNKRLLALYRLLRIKWAALRKNK